MSLPRLERNKTLVKLRRKDPKKWTFTALSKEFGFKSKATAKQIFDTFKHRF